MAKATEKEKQRMREYFQKNKANIMEKEKLRRKRKKQKLLKQIKCSVCGGSIPDYRTLNSSLCSTSCKSKSDYRKHKPKRRLTQSKRFYGDYAEAHRLLLKLETQLKEKNNGT